MTKNKKFMIIFVLFLTEIISVFLTIKSFCNIDVNDYKEENTIKKEKFAMYVENSEGIYEEYNSSNYFPEGYNLNLDKSSCVDINGNIIEGMLSSNNNMITVTSNKTAYCYLYFDKKNLLLYEYLINNNVAGLQKEFIGEDTLYRFSGIFENYEINNYICLGSDSCIDGSDNMYRIIGIEPDTGYIKVIKQTEYIISVWDDEGIFDEETGEVFGVQKWPESDVYTLMNEDFYNSLTFKELIVQHLYGIGDIGSSGDTSDLETREMVYTIENTETINTFIGMLSLSDYYLAYNGDQNWSNTGIGSDNWIHISNNSENNEFEWTMSHTTDYFVWAIMGSGEVSMEVFNSEYAIRPTFYLTNELEYVNGTGTSTDPFIIE